MFCDNKRNEERISGRIAIENNQIIIIIIITIVYDYDYFVCVSLLDMNIINLLF